jgi:uncharacterized repeat protein (TIGR01451 family)/CSLREA domain-containing protein
VAAALAVAVVAGLIGFAPAAQAIGFTVNTFSDAPDAHPGDKHCDSNAGASGDQCTLRAAVMEANARGDDKASMNLPAGTYTLSIPPGATDDDGATGDLDVTTNMGFYGSVGHTVIKGATGFGDRIFDIPSGSPSVTFNGIIVSGGHAPGTGNGGGIRDLTATSVQLTNVTLKDNSAGGSGGGLYATGSAGSTITTNIVTATGNTAGGDGGGIDVEGGLAASLNRLTVSGNHAANGGGVATFVAPGATGSAVFQYDSSFTSNTATHGGGGMDLGRATAAGFTVSGNTADVGGGIQLVPAGKPSSIAGRIQISGNTATTAGGGIYAAGCGATCGTVFNANVFGNSAKEGSGVYVNDGLTLSSVAIYQNTAKNGTSGGAVYHAGSAGNPLVMTNVTINANTGGPVSSGVLLASSAADPITSVTIDGNTGGTANGIAVIPPAPPPLVRDTIVSGGPAKCLGIITSLGNNLDTAHSCGFDKGSDLVDTDPQFEGITVADDNGGFTKTRLLKPSSPAIDAGSVTGCPFTDARAVIRPEGSRCDIGAYEVGPGTRNSDIQLNGLTASPNPVAKGASVTYSMTVTNHGPLPSFETFLTDALPSSLAYKSCSASPAGTCSQSNGVVTITWSAGLAVGATETVTLVAAVASGTTVTSIKNTPMAYSTNPDHYPHSNAATATVTVSG